MGKFSMLGIPLGSSCRRLVSVQQRKVTSTTTFSRYESDLAGIAIMAKGLLIGTSTVSDEKNAIYLSEGITALAHCLIGPVARLASVSNRSTADAQLTNDIKNFQKIVTDQGTTRKNGHRGTQ